MVRVADEIDRRRESLARTLTLDQGKPLHAEAYGEVEELIAYWRNAAEDAVRLEGRLANSVLAGQARAAHPSPARRGGRDHAVELAVHDAGRADRARRSPAATRSSGRRLPARRSPRSRWPSAWPRPTCLAGVFNLVTGPGAVVGDEIARNPGTHAIGFIGSTATGRKVAEAAAGKPLVLELGGNGPLVVMDDADVAAAAEAAIAACFLCAGQSCTAGERLLVHGAVKEEFVARVAALAAEHAVLGDPFADGTTLGPLNNEPVAAKMDEHVADAVERGATVVAGGARAAGYPTGLYWPATILDGVPADSLVAREETFGPVAPIVQIGSLDEAIGLANASPYGLLAAIFTRDLAQGLRFADEVRTGWVNVNESTNYWESHLPFGGRSGSASGTGRVGGSAPMEAFTELQTVVLTA